MQVYFITGLGADKTVFQLLDLQYCEPIFIDWIKPLRNESLPHYALRLKEHYKIADDAVIVGLSFGGMLAIEIAKQFAQTKIIILSSAKTKNEIPVFYRLGKYVPLYKWAPDAVQTVIMLLLEKRFGITSPKGKEIYRNVVKKADITFNEWAVWALLHWDNMQIPPGVIHIHGTKDKILFYKKIKTPVTIKGGGHLMVIEMAEVVSGVLKHHILQKAGSSNDAV
jgi:pimeloyl-ACP methyl ester carboxylesterase